MIWRAKTSHAIAQHGAVNTAGEMVLREHTTLPELPRNIQIVFIFHKIDSGWWPLGMRLEHSKIKLGEPHQERECVFVFNINIPLSLVEASYKQMVFTSDNMDIFFLAVLLWRGGGLTCCPAHLPIIFRYAIIMYLVTCITWPACVFLYALQGRITARETCWNEVSV